MAAAAPVAPAVAAVAVAPTAVPSVVAAAVKPVEVTIPAPRPAPVDSAVTGAIADLGSDDADTARDAAFTLGQSGNAAAVAPLMQAVLNVDGYFHSVVRAAAAEALGRLGDVRALDALVVAVRDPMAESSAEAVRALAMLNDPRAVAALVDVVRNSDGYFLPVVRRAAVLGLAKLGGAEANAELIRIAHNDFEDVVVRQAAIDAGNR